MCTGSSSPAAGGAYSFNKLYPGSYKLEFVNPDETKYSFTLKDAGDPNDDSKDSDADESTGYTGSFSLEVGQTDDTRDCGFAPYTIDIDVDTDRSGDVDNDIDEPDEDKWTK